MSTTIQCQLIYLTLKSQGQISKNSVSKNIVYEITHASFQIYRVYPARVIWKKPTIEDNYVNKLVQLFKN